MEAVGYIATTIVLLVIVMVGAATFVDSLRRRRHRVPKLAGAALPEIGEGLDITKRYDITYSAGDFGSQFTERLVGVRILGYVGSEHDQTVSKMYMRGRWLVVELADQRRAYIMPHSIVSLQEAAQG